MIHLLTLKGSASARQAEPAWKQREDSPDLRPQSATSPAGDERRLSGIKFALSHTRTALGRFVGGAADGKASASVVIIEDWVSFHSHLEFSLFSAQI